MASQLVSDVRCQRLIHCAACYGERGSGYNTLSRRQSYGYHRIKKNSKRSMSIHPEEGSFKEHNPEKVAKRGSTNNLARQQAQKLHRLGFSYLASSFVYVVTKVKAFYNGFLGDVASESRMGIEAPMSEAYFSVPVLPN